MGAPVILMNSGSTHQHPLSPSFEEMDVHLQIYQILQAFESHNNLCRALHFFFGEHILNSL